MSRRLFVAALLFACAPAPDPKEEEKETDAAFGRAGVAAPEEVSAIPPQGSPARQEGLDDYDTAGAIKYVNEPALAKIAVIDNMLNALAQTHYADVGNVGAVPYKATVSTVEDRGNVQIKKTQTWTVTSTLAEVDGREANRVQAWIEYSNDTGGAVLQYAEFDIFTAPTRAADGSYARYGEWVIRTQTGATSFTADAKEVDGESVLTLSTPSGTPFETRAILHRSQNEGYGKLRYRDRVCTMVGCNDVTNEVVYAYDASHLALQTNNEPVVYKQRDNAVTLVLRYGIYDKATRARVAKTFGFPVIYTTGNGVEGHGHYSTWNGRHMLWGDQGAIPVGTMVTRADQRPDVAEKYTVGLPLDGVLTKLARSPGELNDLRGVPVATHVDARETLLFGDIAWTTCTAIDESTMPATCTGTTGLAMMAQYQYDPSSFIPANGPVQPKRQNLRLHRPPMEAVYVVWDEDGLYRIENDMPLQLAPTPEVVTAGALLEISTIGQVFAVWNGTSWTEKTATGNDPKTGEPVFDHTKDKPYDFPLDTPFFAPFANYQVTRTGADAYSVFIEEESTASPKNGATFVPMGAVMKEQTNGGPARSTYTFLADAEHLTLLYLTVSDEDAAMGALAGHEVKKTVVGLDAFVGDTPAGLRFNWFYPENAESPERQSYLLDGAGARVYLDDPIRFAKKTVKTQGNYDTSVLLGFDGGQLIGLTRFVPEGFSNEAADRVVALPDGTELVDASDAAKVYLTKALDQSQVLRPAATTPSISLSEAAALNVAGLPPYNPPQPRREMGAQATQRYSEGGAIEGVPPPEARPAR